MAIKKKTPVKFVFRPWKVRLPAFTRLWRVICRPTTPTHSSVHTLAAHFAAPMPTAGPHIPHSGCRPPPPVFAPACRCVCAGLYAARCGPGRLPTAATPRPGHRWCCYPGECRGGTPARRPPGVGRRRWPRRRLPLAAVCGRAVAACVRSIGPVHSLMFGVLWSEECVRAVGGRRRRWKPVIRPLQRPHAAEVTGSWLLCCVCVYVCHFFRCVFGRLCSGFSVCDACVSCSYCHHLHSFPPSLPPLHVPVFRPLGPLSLPLLTSFPFPPLILLKQTQAPPAPPGPAPTGCTARRWTSKPSAPPKPAKSTGNARSSRGW